MGYQQKLLYISGLVAVGVAILIGIQKFESASSEANLHALTQDLLTIATKAQQYYYKPEFLEGGGLSFDEITADSKGLEKLLVEPQNINGSFQIVKSEDQCLTIEATGEGDFDGDGKNLTIQMKVFADSVQTTVISY
ncbi:hypothetical protein L0Z72_04450 [candidate division KSB1 bacterium]|nr:hypothetical protein [candidate division KSB1 bacterium]